VHCDRYFTHSLKGGQALLCFGLPKESPEIPFAPQRMKNRPVFGVVECLTRKKPGSLGGNPAQFRQGEQAGKIVAVKGGAGIIKEQTRNLAGKLLKPMGIRA